MSDSNKDRIRNFNQNLGLRLSHSPRLKPILSLSPRHCLIFRVWAAIIIISLAGISLEGCYAPPQEQQSMISPIKISYLIQNPLLVTTIEKTDVPNFYESKLNLLGFHDTAIEKSINDSIQKVYADVKDGSLPPYRGIKKKIPEGSELTSGSVSASMSYNYNNVASIVFYGYRNYVTPDQNGVIPKTDEEKSKYSQYVGVTKSLNYDLNTGREITLKDVFTDDVDYIKILNDYIGNLIMNNPIEDEDYYGMAFFGTKLIAPFKGISENQKFYLIQGGIGLILDENNPEFDIGLYPATINIYFQDLGDCIAITKRFYDEAKSPFVSTEPLVKEFMQSGAGQEIAKESSTKVGHIMVFTSERYSENIPKAAKDKIRLLSEIDQNRITKLNADFVDQGQGDSSFEQYVWASKAGPYTNVQRNTSIYGEGKWESSTDTFCFDQDGKEVSLADVFIPGYDYQKLIRKVLQASIDQMPPVKTKTDIDTLMKHLKFFIGNAEINFYTDPIEADVNSRYPISGVVSFKDFGCENMTIFKD